MEGSDTGCAVPDLRLVHRAPPLRSSITWVSAYILPARIINFRLIVMARDNPFSDRNWSLYRTSVPFIVAEGTPREDFAKLCARHESSIDRHDKDSPFTTRSGGTIKPVYRLLWLR